MTAANQTDDLGLWSQVKVYCVWELWSVDVWVKPTNQSETCPGHNSPQKGEIIFCILKMKPILGFYWIMALFSWQLPFF